jgi:uncharacterized membrane protein YjgN (DUF898 family)
MFPAIAYEGTTGLDAIGRSICYVLSKPIWMIFYLAVQLLIGIFFYLAMRGLLFAVLWVTYHSVRFGVRHTGSGPSKLERIWSEPSLFSLLNTSSGAVGPSEQAASVIVEMLMLGITSLIAALVISFAFSSMTIIYAMMRKKVDQTPVGKIWVYLERE